MDIQGHAVDKLSHPPKVKKTPLNMQKTRINSNGGEGIRTPGGLAPTPVFKTGALNRSATPPAFRTLKLPALAINFNARSPF